MEGKAITEYASLSGKIHTLVIDKSLTISGAAADAKATGDRMTKFESDISTANKSVEEAKAAYEEAVAGMDAVAGEKAVEAATAAVNALTAADLDAYTEAQVLANATKTKMGLDESAIPDDAFGKVSELYQHWWSVLHGEAYSYYEEVRTPLTSRAELIVHYLSVDYSKEISIDIAGEIALVNPTKLSFGSNNASITNFCETLVANAPVYVGVTSKEGVQTIYYIPAGATYNIFYEDHVGSSLGYTIVARVNDEAGNDAWLNVNDNIPAEIKASVVTTQLVNVPPGATTYESSADRNAYPDSGKVDGLTYNYLGVPFENARNNINAPRHIQSYVVDAQVTSLTIPLTNIDWASYDYVILDISGYTPSVSTACYINGVTDDANQKYCYLTGTSSISNGAKIFAGIKSPTSLRFKVFKDSSKYAVAEGTRDKFPMWCASSTKYSELTSLLFEDNYGIKAGATFNIYGVIGEGF